MAGYVIIPSVGGAVANPLFPPPPLNDKVDLAASLITTITCTASATPHAAGAWVEVVPSLSDDSTGIYFTFAASYAATTVDTSSILEFGLGTVGNEVVWASALVGFMTARMQVFVPGFIPAGSRVSVRARSLVVSKVFAFLNFKFAGASAAALGAPVNYGFNTAASNGVALAHSGAINTKGAWTQIVAATTAAHSVLGVFPQPASADIVSTILIDIGIGAVAAEIAIVSNIFITFSATESILDTLPSPACFGIDIPIGSRLSARYQTSRSTVADLMTLALVAA